MLGKRSADVKNPHRRVSTVAVMPMHHDDGSLCCQLPICQNAGDKPPTKSQMIAAAVKAHITIGQTECRRRLGDGLASVWRHKTGSDVDGEASCGNGE